MAEYIELPIETDLQTLQDQAVQYLQTLIPGWEPHAGNLDTILIEAIASMAAEQAYVASQVPPAVFRTLGEDLVQIAPIDGVAATGTSTWTMTDTLGHTIEAGTFVSVEDIAFEVVADVIVPPGIATTDPGEVVLQAIELGSAANGLTGNLTLVDTLAYVQSATLVGVTAGGVDPESDDEYLNRLVGELQLLAPRPIVPADFEVLAQRIPTVERATAIDGYNPNNNLLTANQASLEVDTTGWVNTTNVTISRSTAVAFDGAASLRLSSNASGDMVAQTSTGTSGVPVRGGDIYTARASLRAATVGRTCKLRLYWYDAAGALISSSDGTGVADATTGEAIITHQVVLPQAARYVSVGILVQATGAGAELHYVDKIQLRHGTGTTWVAGGTASASNERMVTIAAIDDEGAAVSAATLAAVVAFLDGLRELNFVVWGVDPYYTTVNVAASVSTLPSYDPATVRADVAQALNDYFDPAVWGNAYAADPTTSQSWYNDAVVRYLSVAEVIKRTPGVAFINTLTINGNSTDFNLAGAAALTQPGTMTIT